MWKSAVGHNVSMKVAAEGDDWETDPDFEVVCTPSGVLLGIVLASMQPHRVAFSACFMLQNDVSEQEQRWGAKTIEGSGHKEPIR